jgi:tRNA(Ile)-lysidine synthase
LLHLFSCNLKRMIFEMDISPSIAVGISGGSDSVALLLLAKEWADFCGGKVVALSVDHGLRADSLKDCIFVQNLCNSLNVDCHILTVNWTSIPTSNIQARAREARYALMTDFCKSFNILYLCVGHHEDDVAENFLLRLMRSSGIFGLSMRENVFVNNVMIMRPLLSFKKSDCVKFLMKRGIEWREDASNKNETFMRNRVRLQLGSIIEDSAVIATQKHLKCLADTIVRNSFLDLMSDYVFISELGYAQIECDLERSASKELQYLIVSHLLATIRGANKLPRLESVRYVWNKIFSLSSATLHGCRLIRYEDHIFIIRDFGKEEVQSPRLTDNVLWDKRFLIESKGLNLDEYWSVTRLSAQDFLLLAGFLNRLHCQLNGSLRRYVLSSLPIIKNELGEVVCVPHASYYAGLGRCLIDKVSVKFYSSFVSPFVHFV